MRKTLAWSNRTKSVSNLCLTTLNSTSGNGLGSTPRQGGSPSRSNEYNHLQLLCGFIQMDADVIGLERRQWKVRDLDSLTSDEILKIIAFLLKDINMMGQQVSNHKILPQFGEINYMGDLTYDAAIDEIYHKLKLVFPPNYGLYSVLLMPTFDIKKTRSVLSYVTQFAMFDNDLLEKHLGKCYQEVLDECEEVANLCTEIANLKDQISDVIQNKAKDELQIPKLKNQLDSLSASNDFTKSELTSKEANLKTLKAEYKHGEQMVQLLNQNLEKLVMEVAKAKDACVENPQFLLGESETLRNQNTAEAKKRHELESKMSADVDKMTYFEKMCSSCVDILEELNNKNEELIKLLRLTESCNSTGTPDSKQRKFEMQKRQNGQIKDQHSLKLKEIDETKLKQQQELQVLSEEISNAEWEITKVKGEELEVKREIDQTSEKITKIKTECENLRKTMIAISQTLKEIPNKYAARKAEAVQMFIRIQNELVLYPELDRPRSGKP